MSEAAVLARRVAIAPQFQRSVRIDADYGRPDALNGYVLQATARSVLETIARHTSQSSQQAFTVTGPYGAGKSSLALALACLVGGGQPQVAARKALDVRKRDELARAFCGSSPWLVLPVVGRRAAVAGEIRRAVEASGALRGHQHVGKTPAAIIEALLKLSSSRRFGGVLLLIDELGKFLEQAAATGDDIYFYQELAEAANRSAGKLLVVGVLHQAFEQYASRLGHGAREEWAKVQGRFVDIPLAAGSDETIDLIGRAIQADCPPALAKQVKGIAETVAQTIRTRRPSSAPHLGEALARCWPLHPVTAALLGPSAKRRFGQNERSIFGFLSSAEPLAFREFLLGSGLDALYTPAQYWDYLSANFEAAILASSDGHRWSLGAEAIERALSRFTRAHADLVKTVALIELFRNGSGLAAEETLLATCLPAGASPVRQLLAELAEASILIFRRHLDAWGVYQGSDFDIEAAVRAYVAEHPEPDLKRLAAVGDLHPITARRHYAERGTMRWFRRLLAWPNDAERELGEPDPRGATGAFALLIPASADDARSAKALARELSSKPQFHCHALGVPHRAERIAEFALELEALRAIQAGALKIHDDRVARREVEARINHVSGRLGDELGDAFTEADWYWRGEKHAVARGQGLSRFASIIADEVYQDAPRLHSELVNRDELSSAAAKAQRELMHRLLSCAREEDLGYERFSADRGLYESLIKPARLHRPAADGGWQITAPDGAGERSASLLPLWKATGQFLGAEARPVDLAEIYGLWRERFGLRKGVMPILATAFFLAHRASLALYMDGVFNPDLSDADLDAWLQDPRRVAWRYVRIEGDGEAMLRTLAATLRERLGREVAADPLDAARGLVRLVVGLPDWTRRTSRLTDDARQMRDLLLKASDPHKVLFVDLPAKLGIRADQRLAERVSALAAELEQAYPGQLRAIEAKLLQTLDHRGEISDLLARAKVAQGISGDFRLDAFVARLLAYDGSLDALQGLLMLALNKPASQWTDGDFDAAHLQLCEWAMAFRRVEVLAAFRDRPSTRRAIAVVFGAGGGHGGKTVSDTIEVASYDAPEVERVVEALLATCQQRQVKREVLLAAFAEAGARLVEAGEHQ